MLYFADVFYIFFMTALVGQTAERIFTKPSHVVDIRCYLRTSTSIYSWPSLNYTVGQKMTKFCIFFDPPVPFLLSRPNAAKYRNSKKTGSPRKVLYTCANFDELWPTNPWDQVSSVIKVELAAASVHPVGMISSHASVVIFAVFDVSFRRYKL